MNKKFIIYAGLLFSLIMVCFTSCILAQQSQPVKKENRTTLPNALKKITKTLGTQFIYDPTQLQGKYTNYNLDDIKTKHVEEILKAILYPNDLVFLYVKANYYTIVNKERVGESLQTQSMVIQGQTPVNNVNNIATPTERTTGRARGTVIDEATKLPLSNVTVTEKGTNNAVATDANGNFSILLKKQSNAVLVFTIIGYESQQLKFNGNENLNVSLITIASSLNEVVVVGYGTVKKKDVTGSIAQVKIADLQKAPVISFEEAMGGRVSGVRVTSADGQPGATINVVIRGNNSVTQDNSPLYIIDGFPMEGANNYAINPSEIESIEVLKDASSTAIYGARGANGVIIITTKKGKIGDPIINYNTYFGFMQNKRKMKLMDAYEFVKYQIERDSVNANKTYLINGKTLDDFKNENTIDLQDEIFRKSPFQNHFISVSGGKGGTRYSVSGSILHQDGVIKNSGYDRYQGRVNFDQTINPNLKVGINTNYSWIHKYGTPPAAQLTGFFYGNLLYSVWGYRPASGKFVADPIEDQNDDFLALAGFNPIQSVQNELRATSSNILIANAYGEYSFGKYVKLRVTGGLTKTINRSDVFNNSLTRVGSPLTTTGQNNGVSGSIIYDELNSLLNENTLTFNKTFHTNHSLEVLTGFTMQKTTVSSYGAAANHIPNESLGLAGLDEGQPVSVTSTASLNTLASFLGRVNYSYKSKYLLTGSFRADGSSKFSTDNRWSYFPSGALAWRLGQEKFMKIIPKLSDAKMRVSYGLTGNNRVSDFAYLSRISLPSTLGYSYNNSPVNASILSTLGNVNLKWESTSQLDVGLELSFLKERLSFVGDVYKKITSNLLLNALVPNSTGFTNAIKNIGKVQNQGLELTLNSVNFKTDRFSWNSNFNISFNRNKVLALAENQTALYTLTNWNIDLRSVPLYVAALNEPIARFYGYIWDGNYQYSDFDQPTPGVYVLKSGIATYNANRALTKPGDIKYEDVNGDGIVNSLDQTVIGDPNPKFTGGFSNDFTFKNFDLNVFLEYSVGNDIMNANRIVFEGGGRVNQNMYAAYENRWTPDNQNNDYYRTGGGGPVNFGYSTRVVEDGSYLRLKTVSLGYNFSPKLLNRIRLKTFRLYVSAQNLATWTKYKGFDPEVSAFGSSALQPGFDYSVYPRSRTITVGANISL